MRTLIPVLLYHSVNDRAGAGDRPWTVSPRDFASHMEVVSASGRVPMTVTEIAGALRGERALPPRPVGITFDDGYADSHDALAFLHSRSLKATIYITTGEVGGRDRLSPGLVAELASSASVEVGAHAVRHRRLDELGLRELAAEVIDSRLQLEDITGARVDSFAYPHGAYARSVREAVVGAGYRSAAAVKNALSHDRDDPFAIARFTVTAGMPASRIASVLKGETVPTAWAHDRLRTRAYRAARRGRRRVAVTVGRER